MSEDWKEQLAKKTGYKEPLPQQAKGGEQKVQIQFYSNEGQKIIHKDLLDGTAKRIASGFVGKLNSTQLRKFHNDIRDLEAKVEAHNPEEFKTKILPLVKMMKSKVAYASGKKKVPMEFGRMLNTCVDNIKEKRDFEVFSLFFEAVVGYFYGEGGQ